MPMGNLGSCYRIPVVHGWLYGRFEPNCGYHDHRLLAGQAWKYRRPCLVSTRRALSILEWHRKSLRLRARVILLDLTRNL